MISYNEMDKTLMIRNSRIHVEILLDSCFCIKSVYGKTGQKIGEQQQYILTYDRNIYDLSISGSCEVSVGKSITKDNSDSVVVTITLPEKNLTIEKHIFLYGDAGAVRFYDEFAAAADCAGMLYSDLFNIRFALDYKYKCVDFFSCTDQSNYRLIEKVAEKKNVGSFIIAEHENSDNNFFVYKEGPCPDNQVFKTQYDYTLIKNSLTMVGLGFDNINEGEVRRANGVVFGFAGEVDCLPELRRYQNLRYELQNFSPEVLSNVWPTFHTNINEAKMLDELDYASKTGVETVFIDDGWFETFMGEVDINKFPDKFSPLQKKAEAIGVNVGLWIHPFGMQEGKDPKTRLWDGTECHDCISNDLKWNWIARSSDFIPVDLGVSADGEKYYAMDLLNEEYFQHAKNVMVGNCKEYGIKRFKLDFYRIHNLDTMLGDQHLHFEAYRRLLAEARKEIPGLILSMDITRRSRPGFDFALDYGRLFMENRGRGKNTSIDDHRYYQPYITLRNFWSTAKYIPAQKIEVEVMPQIDDYDIDYILGTAIFGNMLYWGSLTGLTDEKQMAMKKFIEDYRPHQKYIFDNLVLTSGEMPELGNWSIFVSYPKDAVKGAVFYIGVYKNGSAEDSCKLSIPVLGDATSILQNVADGNDCFNMKNGKFALEMKKKFEFKLLKGTL
jgi:alpha-galactosidase